MKRTLLLSAGALLTLSSALAMAQDSPESLLPPGFEKPKANPPKPAASPASTGSNPVVQPIPVGSAVPASPGTKAVAPSLPSGARIPTLRELETMNPDQIGRAHV